MANKASAAAVQGDMQPPNYRAAVQRIRTIQAKKDKIGSVNGEIADIYAKVEGHKVNRKGAKIFYALDRMTPEERQDVMRSLNGLCDAAGWDDNHEDLVDQAEGNVVSMRFGGGQADGDADLDEAIAEEAGKGDDVDEALAEDFTEATDEELAAQAGRAESKTKERARKKLDDAAPAPGTGAAAIAAMKKAAEEGVPFTGDNSDLAGGE